jgi:hypothetical protein
MARSGDAAGVKVEERPNHFCGRGGTFVNVHRGEGLCGVVRTFTIGVFWAIHVCRQSCSWAKSCDAPGNYRDVCEENERKGIGVAVGILAYKKVCGICTMNLPRCSGTTVALVAVPI